MAIYALLDCSDRARIPLYIVASLSRGVEHEARALFEIVSFALQAQETAQVAHSNVLAPSLRCVQDAVLPSQYLGVDVAKRLYHLPAPGILYRLYCETEVSGERNEVEYDEMNSSTRHLKPTLSRTTGDSTRFLVSTSARRVSFCESDVSESDVPRHYRSTSPVLQVSARRVLVDSLRPLDSAA